MTSLLWQHRLDVAICLLLQTTLIGALQWIQHCDKPTLGSPNTAMTRTMESP